MLNKITMPSMGATIEEGTIVVWSLNEGDRVNAGDVLVEIESDKATFDYESPCDGVVRKILVEEGETVPVGQLIAIVGDEGEEIPADWLESAAEESARSSAQVTQAGPQAKEATKPAGTGRVKISPRARKLAEKLGVDVANVTGSGPGGRIESFDIEKAGKQIGEPSELIPFTTVRRQINRMVTRSKREIPHFYVEIAVDMTAAMAYRDGKTGRIL